MNRHLASLVLAACAVAGCGPALDPPADSSHENRATVATADVAEEPRSLVESTDSDARCSREEFADIANRFRENRLSFETLRVVEQRVRTVTKEHFLWLANGFEKAADQPELAKERRDELLRNAADRRQQAESAPVVTRYFQDFHTDGKRFQARAPRNARDARDWRFPDESPLPEALATTYKDYNIYSYTASSEHPLRLWTGFRGKGITFAQISSRREYEEHDSFWFPPLVTGTGNWGQRKWHPIDEFFLGAIDEYQVLGNEKVGDANLALVEHKHFTETALESDRGEVLQQVVIRKAWIDPRRGAMPMRIEERVGLAVSDHVLGESSLQRVIVVTDAKRVDGAGYYPVDGTIETYVLPPRPERPFRTVSDWTATQTPQPPPVVGETIAWTIEHLQANTAMDSELFALIFPANVGVLVNGLPIEIRKSVPPLAVDATAPDWVVSGWTDGETRSLSDYRGKVVVLDFWGTWCGPCRRAIPTMNRLLEKHSREDVVFLAIHTAGPEIEEVRTQCQELKSQLVCAVDAGLLAEHGETVSRYRIRGFPTVVIIDKSGRVAFNDGDVSDRAAVERRVAEIEASSNLPRRDREPSAAEMMDRTEHVREALLNDEIVRALAR